MNHVRSRVRRCRNLFFLTCFSVTASGAQLADEQGTSHEKMQHYGHNSAAMAIAPTLSGQYAFATISEIVLILRENSDTDWSKVDLAKLRAHLVDMNNVTIQARVSAADVDGGAYFDVTSENSAVVDSIRRMVSAHTMAMSSKSSAGNYQFTYSQINEGVRLTVQSDTERDALIIRALGFHGLLAEGDHHRQHHWMLATGRNPH